jgi:hypothetical protein
LEILVKALKDSYDNMIKTTQFNGDKDQCDICTASSAMQSAGVKHDELPTAIITVKGMWNSKLKDIKIM